MGRKRAKWVDERNHYLTWPPPESSCHHRKWDKWVGSGRKWRESARCGMCKGQQQWWEREMQCGFKAVYLRNPFIFFFNFF